MTLMRGRFRHVLCCLGAAGCFGLLLGGHRSEDAPAYAVTDLGPPGGDPDTFAGREFTRTGQGNRIYRTCQNRKNDSAGFWVPRDDETGCQLVLWNGAGKGTRRAALPNGSRYGEARNINASRLVVGWRKTRQGYERAFCWDTSAKNGADPPRDLQERTGLPSWRDALRSMAEGVNDEGVVVGWWQPNGMQNHRAFLYRYRENVVRDLDAALPAPMRRHGPGVHSEAHDINNRGQIVGEAGTGLALDPLGQVAVLWEGNAAARDLNEMIPPGSGWKLLAARGIDDAGRIWGEALCDGEPRRFLLTPAPAASVTGSSSRLAAR